MRDALRGRATTITRTLARDSTTDSAPFDFILLPFLTARSPGRSRPRQRSRKLLFPQPKQGVSMPACAADIRPAYAPSLIPWLARFARVGTRAEVERISRALATLNGRVYEDLIPMLDDIGLAHDLHREGALTLYETEAGYRRDSAEWSCKQARGIEVHEVSGAQVREMEPAIGPRVLRIGGTNAAADFRRSHRLLDLAKQFLPTLDIRGNCLGRPQTGHARQSSRYWALTLRPRVCYAFGHGHLGLTAGCHYRSPHCRPPVRQSAANRPRPIRNPPLRLGVYGKGSAHNATNAPQSAAHTASRHGPRSR